MHEQEGVEFSRGSVGSPISRISQRSLFQSATRMPFLPMWPSPHFHSTGSVAPFSPVQKSSKWWALLSMASFEVVVAVRRQGQMIRGVGRAHSSLNAPRGCLSKASRRRSCDRRVRRSKLRRE